MMCCDLVCDGKFSSLNCVVKLASRSAKWKERQWSLEEIYSPYTFSNLTGADTVRKPVIRGHSQHPR